MGDASLILAPQLIAAKLNVADGAFGSSGIQDAINGADAILGGYAGKLPYQVRPNTNAGKTMTGLVASLEVFNQGY